MALGRRKSVKNIYSVLKEHFGYFSFRPGQEGIIRAILSGRDAAAIMPTGAGKSLCYQIPALAFDGITIVISPLISLMQDQVRTLIASGVRAAYINSSLTPGQTALALRNATKGMYKIIYAAPERLDSPSFLSFAMNSDISLVAVDEAHCISQWGQDFRPAYLRIAEFITKLRKRPVVTAFTATATEKVKQDIISKTGLVSPYLFKGGFDRENLYFSVEQPFDRMDRAKNYILSHKNDSGILYCLTRKQTEDAVRRLSAEGISIGCYHAGMSDEARKKAQDDFIYDRIKVIAATSAFGMGIDKPDVRYVIHMNMPARMEDYYQQAGRAGRDGMEADCILLFSGRDVGLNRYMIEKEPEDDPLTPEQRKEYNRARLACLDSMVYYSTSKHTCLRRRILSYFGQNAPESCHNCSICRKKPIELPEVFPMLLQYDESLFEALKNGCRRMAIFAGVPSYTIAGEKVLKEMAARKPETITQLRQVEGFGEEKIRRWGADFIAIIKKYNK